MQKWRDTVMSDEQIAEIWRTWIGIDCPDEASAEQIAVSRLGDIAKAQAEISFKLGIKEVVEYAEMWGGYRLTENSKWQAKLKEWGIDG